MNKWLRKFEDIMAASAFAEAGEFETARTILKKKRRILLALTGDASDRNAFGYALDMCRHKGADLDILYVSEVPRNLLRQFRSRLRKEGIQYRLIQAGGSLEEDIENHTGRKRDKLFVVVEVSEDAETYSRKEDRILSEAWKNLQCPLAVISKGRTAFGTGNRTGKNSTGK